MTSVGFLLVAVVFGTLGQLCFKAGAQGAKIDSGLSMFSILFTPYILLGLLFYGLGTMAFLKVLSREALSYAYPMISLTYPLVLVFSMLIFKESVPWARWIGVALIMLGVFLVGKRF